MDDFLKSLEEDNPRVEESRLSCKGCIHINKRYPFVTGSPCCYCLRAHQEDFYKEEIK